MVPNQLDALGGKPVLLVLHHGSGVDRSIGPGRKPLLQGHLLLENLHEPAQGLHYEVGIDLGLPEARFLNSEDLRRIIPSLMRNC